MSISRKECGFVGFFLSCGFYSFEDVVDYFMYLLQLFFFIMTKLSSTCKIHTFCCMCRRAIFSRWCITVSAMSPKTCVSMGDVDIKLSSVLFLSIGIWYTICWKVPKPVLWNHGAYLVPSYLQADVGCKYINYRGGIVVSQCTWSHLVPLQTFPMTAFACIHLQEESVTLFFIVYESKDICMLTVRSRKCSLSCFLIYDY